MPTNWKIELVRRNLNTIKENVKWLNVEEGEIYNRLKDTTDYNLLSQDDRNALTSIADRFKEVRE